jgi:hypothetical protein
VKNLKLIEHHNIKRVEVDGTRYYVTPKGNKYISITTFLGKTENKDFLKDWQSKVGEEVASKISEEARNNGNNLHWCCEQYLLNKEFEFPTKKSKLFFKQIADYLKNIDEVYGIEIPLYSDKLRLAGTSDCVGMYKGDICIIDFKNSRKLKKEEWIQNYFLQGAFYSLAYYEMYGIFPKNIVIMIATGELEPQIFIKDSKEYIIKLIALRKKFPNL